MHKKVSCEEKNNYYWYVQRSIVSVGTEIEGEVGEHDTKKQNIIDCFQKKIKNQIVF